VIEALLLEQLEEELLRKVGVNLIGEETAAPSVAK